MHIHPPCVSSCCKLCNIDYVGQTIQSMRERHWGHRSEIRSGADGLGRHFLSHGENLNLKNEKIFEENVMQHFELTIIASVQPGQPWTQDNLDRLEGKFQKKSYVYGLHWDDEYEG